MEVVPLINSEREVSLDILQKIDEVSGSTRIDNNDIPNIATRYVKTSVTVPNDGTLILGGLIKQSMNRSRSGIPWLSSIPVLGYLFSNTSKEKIRTELVILIRPMVSWAPPEAIQLREARHGDSLNIGSRPRIHGLSRRCPQGGPAGDIDRSGDSGAHSIPRRAAVASIVHAPHGDTCRTSRPFRASRG